MNQKIHIAFAHILLLGSLAASPMLLADEPTSSSNPAAEQAVADPSAALEAEMDAAFEAASQVMQTGPADIPLRDQATLKLPEGYGFIPSAEARRLLESMGNTTDDQDWGLIVPRAGDESWFMVVSYQDAGYIKDDDAKDWDADELLSSIRAGTEASNEERRARGIPEMEVVGWIEKPQYNAATRQLVWSIESRDKDQPADAVNGINYNTLALGREGYMSMNLVTDVATVESLKPTAKNLLAALSFDEGKRYSDFNANTDKVAEYGLAALVAGVAAKKLGLLAVITAFLIKFWKLLIIAVLGGGGFLRNIFKRKDTNVG